MGRLVIQGHLLGPSRQLVSGVLGMTERERPSMKKESQKVARSRQVYGVERDKRENMGEEEKARDAKSRPNWIG